ncbi:MAG: YhcB family protein [Myxococcota bacterium]
MSGILGLEPPELLAAASLFVAGILLGVWTARRDGGARVRVRALEAELAQAHERLARYRDQVEKHFSQTSDLFAELTRQYTAVWDHLADGARELCPERSLALARGFAGGSRLLTNPAGSDPASAAAEGPTEAGGDEDEEGLPGEPPTPPDQGVAD